MFLFQLRVEKQSSRFKLARHYTMIQILVYVFLTILYFSLSYSLEFSVNELGLRASPAQVTRAVQ